MSLLLGLQPIAEAPETTTVADSGLLEGLPPTVLLGLVAVVVVLVIVWMVTRPRNN